MAAAMAGIPMPDDLYADKSYKLIITAVVAFALATLGLAGRFAARTICKKRLELNDYFIILAYTIKLGFTILSSLLVTYGMGRHIYILTPEQITSYLKGVWTGSFIYAPCIAFIKLSILSLYHVAFPSRNMRIAVWVVAAITAAWGFALCLVGLMACLPIHKSWDLTGTVEGTCINSYRYYYGLQIPNIITDFAILFLPFNEIYKLKLPWAQIAQIGGVLGLGLVTCIFDIIRLVVFIQMPEASPDITWINLPPAIWLDIEASVALLCACLPVMRPLLHPKRFWHTHHTSAVGVGDSTHGSRGTGTGGDGFKSPESDVGGDGAVQGMEMKGRSEEVSRSKSSGGISGGSGSGSQSEGVDVDLEKGVDGGRRGRVRTTSTGLLQARGAGRAI
ncbi:MAG: hypothetical protein M1831_006201 [Alyxoria varia]|nr:MAG: hypothetical protein M1831_006201 [Alyxoria varia]